MTLPENGSAGTGPESCEGKDTLLPNEVCQPECDEGYDDRHDDVFGFRRAHDDGVLHADARDLMRRVRTAENGDVGTGNTKCSRTMEAGTTCSPRCDKGYVVSGVTTCSDLGVLVPTCIAEDAAPDCDASAPPENGSVGDCTDSLVCSSCQPDCNDGFEADGTSKC